MPITQLLQLSARFHARAHESNNPQLICLAIKPLLLALERYTQHLEPELEARVCFQLASIYHETTSHATAEEYAHRAVAVAKRNGLEQMEVAAQLLLCQIIEYPRVVPYLNECIAQHHNLFALAKVHVLLRHDPGTALVLLEQLTSRENCPELALLLLAQLHLQAASPHEAKKHLDRIDTLHVQLSAMKQLLVVQYHMATGQTSACKKAINALGAFVSDQKQHNWQGWSPDGRVTVAIGPHHFAVDWLDHKEFLVWVYILTGVSLLPLAHDAKMAARAGKVFGISSELIEDLGHGSSVRRQQRAARAALARSTLAFYTTWLRFVSGDFSDIAAMTKLHQEKPLPQSHYLLAVYNQYHGHLARAKSHFLACRELTRGPQSSEVTGIATPRSSDLHVFSSLHLLVLTLADNTHQDAADLRRELADAITANHTSSAFSRGFAPDDALFKCTLAAINDTPHDELVPHLATCPVPYLKTLVLFELYLKAPSVELRKKYLARCIKHTESPLNDNDRVLALVVLSELHKQCMELGDSDSASLTSLRIQVLHQHLQPKFLAAGL